MKLLRKIYISLPLAILLFLMIPHNSQAQCACVWLDPSGVKQCVLYPNCSGAFFSSCGAQLNGSNFLCTGPGQCQVYPGSTAGCVPQCLGNGACWYNGNKCVASSICPTILPIGLIDLEGKTIDGLNVITWKTAFESNNDYFAVFRSTDGENWTEMVRLPGAGTSTDVLSYSVTDAEPEDGINYYRIMQVDFDGQAASYGPISFDNSSTPRMLVKTVDFLGKEVGEDFKGFAFNCYSDGTTEKIFR
ncbi:MAG: hypothetical protein HWE22_05950 [Flavobacteriales bacterium]|nr:hypothetical protein [Flavobacteriales bacterium]